MNSSYTGEIKDPGVPLDFIPLRGLFDIVTSKGQHLPEIIAQVVVEETHHDELEITDHPIQVGSSIVDHAFKRPAEITLQLGWSNSPSDSTSVLNPNYVQEVYQKLQELQVQLARFTVYTGKRQYENMMCQSLSTETTFKTAYTLSVKMVCKQLILVNTQTVPIPAATAKNPSKNATPQQTGQKTLKQTGVTGSW